MQNKSTELRMLIATTFFDFEDSVQGRQINDIYLTKNYDDLKRSVEGTNFFGIYGSINFNVLAIWPHFEYSVWMMEQEDDSEQDLMEMHKSGQTSSFILDFLEALWYVRDNSASIGTTYCMNMTKGNGHSTSKELRFSNAKGLHEKVTFTLEEINQAVVFLDKIYSFSNYLKLLNPKMDETYTISYSPMDEVPYKELTRIDRALMFLSLARSKTYLPTKIAFYIAILESLFTTDKIEVTHKVTERVTLYLGGSLSERKANFSLVKTAYGIRSSFVHGQVLDKSFKTSSDLVEISVKTDEVLRKVLTKIIAEDSEIFLKPNSELNDWFTDILLWGRVNEE